MSASQIPTFGALLRHFRTLAHLTREELAECASVAARTITALETGENRAPRKDTLSRLVAALRIPADDRALLEDSARRSRLDRSATRVSAVSRAQVTHTYSPLENPPIAALSTLVGRKEVISTLERHLLGREIPALFLAGEPGIGKTRLLREVVLRAQELGWRVLAGGCHRRSAKEPYAPFPETLHRYIISESSLRLQAALEGGAGLMHLLPELRDLLDASNWMMAPDQARRMMFESVRRFLDNVAGPAGTLLVLDDLQWAGVDALDLLAHLISTAPSTPLSIVAAYRQTEVHGSDPLAILLVDLMRAGIARREMLGPLSMEDAMALLRGTLSRSNAENAHLIEQLAHRTGCVPFFLISSAQALQEGLVDEDGLRDLPEDVLDAVRQRVALLPETCREVLGVAAVVGRTAPAWLIFDVSSQLGFAKPVVVDALETSCHARLLEEVREDLYDFAHDLIHEAVLADLSTARQHLLHEYTAEALEHRSGAAPTEALAHHYIQAGMPEKAIPNLELAGDKARMMYANAEAAACYGELIVLLDQMGYDLESAAVRVKRGAVLLLLTRYDEALAVLDQSVESYRVAQDFERLAQAASHIGTVHVQRGTLEEGIERMLALLETLPTETPSPSLAQLYVALADLYWITTQSRERLAAAEQAVRIARAAGDDLTLARAEVRQGAALLELGSQKHGTRLIDGSLPFVERAGDIWSIGYALESTAMALEARGALALSRRAISGALLLGERIGDAWAIAWMLYRCGMNSFLAGRWDEARDILERSLAFCDRMTTRAFSPYPLLGLASLARARGNGKLAEELLDAAARTGRADIFRLLRPAHEVLAEYDLLEGVPHQALARLRGLLDLPGREHEPNATPLLPLLAWANLDLGEEGDATGWLTRSLTRARDERNRLALVMGLRVQARLLVRQGHRPEALTVLRQALGICRRYTLPYHKAKVQVEYGLELFEQRALPQARRQFEAASRLLCVLGETPYFSIIEQALVRV